MRLTHARETGVLSVTMLSTSHGPHIYHKDLTWPFVVLAGKDFAPDVCNFSTAEQTCCRTLEKNYGKRVQMKKKRETERERKTSCSTVKCKEASNCFPSVCDPVTLEELFLVLLLRATQHSLLIWWHKLIVSHNAVL